MTITYHELKARQRKATREELKHIESALHPCLQINGFDILHEHKGQKIIFSAWKGDKPAQPITNRKVCTYDRWYVYCNADTFYQEERENLAWLTTEE